MAKKQTVKDLEAKTGKPDSIRNVNGKNARSDKQIETIEKELARLVPGLTLPKELPTVIVLQYPGNVTKYITGLDIPTASAVLNALGLM